MGYPITTSQQTQLQKDLNLIINGNFDIWQVNTTFTPNDDTYTADLWNLLVETNGSWTIARDTTLPLSGSRYSLKASNVTANNQCALVQFLEADKSIKLLNKTVSLSFQARTTSSEISKLRVAILSWTGTADTPTSDVISAWGQNGTTPTWATNWVLEGVTDATLSDTFQTFKLENILIDTVGTNNIAVVVWVDDGTITSGDDFWLSQIQLNEGVLATGFQDKGFEEELEDCMRFYESTWNYGVANPTSSPVGAVQAQSDSTTTLLPGTQFRRAKVKVPNVTLYSGVSTTASRVAVVASGAENGNAASANDITVYGFRYVAGTSFSTNTNYQYHYIADARL